MVVIVMTAISCLSNHTVYTSKQLATTAKFLNVHANVQKTFAVISSFINMHLDDESYLSCTVKVETLAKRRGVSVRTILRHTKTLAEKGIITVLFNSSRNNAGLPERLPNSYLVMPNVIDSLIEAYNERVSKVRAETLAKIKAIRDKALAVIAARKNKSVEVTVSPSVTPSVSVDVVADIADHEETPPACTSNGSAVDLQIRKIYDEYVAITIYDSRDHAYTTMPKSHFLESDLGAVYHVKSRRKRILVGVVRNSHAYDELRNYMVEQFRLATSDLQEPLSQESLALIDKAKKLAC
ncbi:helix-turn-helix domain-containing protein [Photobacterium leiognathi]|uniref:helix-turn-helix domain-containing protein n=1 Tax=Photobacterium leiognathi TaxID=553611 RepID=UPI002981159B|nr:helix-turn-helix domain-containing protein [Photobacterium leiognathi]